MTSVENKQQVIERLQWERAAWEALLAEVGEERMTQPGPMGDWTMKDTVAHVTGWGQEHIAHLQAAQRGDAPASPLDTGEDVDVINQRIYNANVDKSLHDVLNESRAFWKQLEDLMQATTEEDLIEPERFSWTKGKALGSMTVDNLANHIHDEHEPGIRAWVAQSL